MFKIFKIIIICLGLFYLYSLVNFDDINIKWTSIYNTSNRDILIEKEYYMLIEIPKIDLQKEIYSIGSVENNIDKNVMLLYEGYTTIIVAHSGNNDNAYFRNLKNLKINDEVILYKEKNNSIYKVDNISYMDKNKVFELKKEYADKLVLITCLNREKYIIMECVKI